MKDLEKLIDNPEEFFRELQRRYVFKDPDISKIAKELADGHRDEEKNPRVRESFLDLVEKNRENKAKKRDS